MPSNGRAFLRNRLVWIGTAALGLLALTIFWLARPAAKSTATIFAARRGPLDVTVVEGGSVQALESQESRSEVKGYQGTKILKIVEEGYAVTEEDVKSGKVLVELDSSEIRNKITQQDIQFESTAASLIDAQQAYDIQVNQNLSDVMAAEQKAKFARMDFEKFMGSKAAADIISQLGLELDGSPPAPNTAPTLAGTPAPLAPPLTPSPTNLAAVLVASAPLALAAQSDVPASLIGSNAAAVMPPPSAPRAVTPPPARPPSTSASSTPVKASSIDFGKYANSDLLGDGEAKQKIRKLDDDLQVAEKERLLAQSTYEGTKRLFDREFATRTELDNDEVKLQNSRLKVQTAETARALFLNYEFLKTSEETLSKFAEAARELDRARKGAISKLAQAEAKLKSAQGKYSLESRQRDELNEQLDKCLIKAKRQGLVVYGGGNEDGFYYGEERIREGATVRERQAIITIPDTTKMAVKVKIHETYIKKVEKGQKAKITVDAFPDKMLEGEVMKVGVLPDSQNRWMNPDLKVYLTTVRIDGTYDWLKPGMSAKVEIMVKRLPDVVYVPLQAVVPEDGKQYCYLASGGGEKRVEVEPGDFTDDFIEIKQGLKEGDRVCLRAPEAPETKPSNGTGEAAKDKAKPEAPPPAPKPNGAG
ncbi:MAG: HlyD family efflux transporter periplasmic adaptor subunit [Verrucomicrobiota bacterium]